MKRLGILLISLLLVVLVASTAAQDPMPTETPSPLPTEISPPTEALLPSTETPVPPTDTQTPSPPDPPTDTLLPTTINTYTALPSETAFITPTVFISETPLATMTFTPTPPAPTLAWLPVFSDSFTIIDVIHWNFTGPGWAYDARPDGSGSVVVFNSSTPVLYQGMLMADSAVEVIVDISNGNAHVYVRHSGAFGYEAILTTTGEVSLLRAGLPLAVTRLLDFRPDQPHLLRLNSYANHVWVDVDGATLLSTVDPAPLPPGYTGFAASFPALPAGVTPAAPQYTVQFDAAVIYQPTDQVTPTVIFPTTTPLPLPTSTPTVQINDSVPTTMPDVTAELTAEATAETTLEPMQPEITETLQFAAPEVVLDDSSELMLFSSFASDDTFEQVFTIDFDGQGSYSMNGCGVGSGRSGAGWQCSRPNTSAPNGGTLTFSPQCNVSYVSFDFRSADTSGYPHVAVALDTDSNVWSQNPYWYGNGSYSAQSGWNTIVGYDSVLTPRYVDTFYIYLAHNQNAGYGNMYVDNIQYRCMPDSTQPDSPSPTSIIDFDGQGTYAPFRCGIGVGRENSEGEATAGWQCSRPNTTAPNGGLLSFSPQCLVTYVSFDLRSADPSGYPHVAVVLSSSANVWNQSPAWYANGGYPAQRDWTTFVGYNNPSVPRYVDTFWLYVAHNQNAGYGYINVDNIRYTCSRPTLTLEIDPALAPAIPQTEDGAYIFTVGDQIPLLAQVGVEGPLDITDPVRIELTVPRALRPQGMTIQGEDPIRLSDIFGTLICVLTGGSNCGDLLNEILEILLTPDMVSYTYDIEDGVTGGQQFPITLDVVGNLPGTFTISGNVATLPVTLGLSEAFASFNSLQAEVQAQSSLSAFSQLLLQVSLPPTACTAVNLTQGVNIRSGPGETFAIVGSIPANTSINIIGRTQNGNWLRVQKRSDGLEGFSSASLLSLAGNCNNLPLYFDDGTPFPTPTPTATATPTATLDPNITPSPTFTSSPTFTPTLTPTYIPRTVEPPAQSFHDMAAQFGLPAPFNLWPVVASDDFQNGYGPNWFAQNSDQECDLTPVPTPTATAGPNTPTPTPDPCPYRSVNSIHPGVDYHTDPLNSIVIALCDGIIVPGRREPREGFTNDPYGGSAAGWGLTLRCFADDPNDPDGDGLRNLSNIIVVYNHLRIDQTVTNDAFPPDNAYQIVYEGQPLATTDASGTPYIHLDLQLYIADGHRSQNAMQLNPRFMNPATLRVDIAGAPRSENEQAAYPALYNVWSLQGRLEGAGRGIVHFWTQPTAAPFLDDATGYLEDRYPTGTRYIGPNCGNMPSNVDISASWWNSPSRIVECIVTTGLGDA